MPLESGDAAGQQKQDASLKFGMLGLPLVEPLGIRLMPALVHFRLDAAVDEADEFGIGLGVMLENVVANAF